MFYIYILKDKKTDRQSRYNFEQLKAKKNRSTGSGLFGLNRRLRKCHKFAERRPIESNLERYSDGFRSRVRDIYEAIVCRSRCRDVGSTS